MAKVIEIKTKSKQKQTISKGNLNLKNAILKK